MAKVIFYIRGVQNPTSIYLRFRAGRNIDLRCKTNLVVDPKRWSTAKGAVKNLNDSDLKTINQKLIDLDRDIIKLFNDTEDKSKVTVGLIMELINPPEIELETPIVIDLIEWFDLYIKHKENEVSASSIIKLNSNKHLIQRFEKHRKKKLSIKDINQNFKLEFENYCRDQKYAQNTIARSMRFIKSICYFARNNGVETSFQLDSVITKNEKVEKIYLTLDEISTIQKTELEHEYQINARDWLIISCETGQRVSDFMRFNKEMIRTQKSADGKREILLIEFTQKKTRKIMSTPLSKSVLDILKKRQGEFPRAISSVKYNLYIKEVCKKAGLTQEIKGGKIDVKTNRKVSGSFPKWELVTSHIGRRTYATNNYGKIPTPLLMSATGHSTEKMFLEYIGKTDTDLAMQLAEYY